MAGRATAIFPYSCYGALTTSNPACGWPPNGQVNGSWQANGSVSEDSFVVEFAIGVRRLQLEPGEKLAFPVLHTGLFQGGSRGGTNAVRRYVFNELQPDCDGERPYGKVHYWTYNGLQNEIDTDGLLRQADRAAELGIEVFEVDAGWHGDFAATVGDWRDVDRTKFPDGLEPLAEHVRKLGMDFGLWFEPEKAQARNLGLHHAT